ncbi:MAG: hypothetical protein AAGA22_03365 [Pseudomonadota bacterium]
MSSRIEAIFGGLLVLLVLVAAIWALVQSGSGNARVADKSSSKTVTLSGLPGATSSTGSPKEYICPCYDAAFDLAGSDVNVMSAEYRTGYEQCRGVGADVAAKAWTAGWNARLSAKPFEASCKAYERSQGY